jgi:hypothetical protein
VRVDERHLGADREPAVLGRPGVDRPAVEGDALGHAEQSAPGRAGRSRTVVGDGEDEPIGLPAEPDLGPAGPGMAEHVDEGLLYDPVGSEVQPRRQRLRSSVVPQVHVQP